MSEIIVGVEPDRTPEAEDALALGALIARADEARVLAVSVVDPGASIAECERALGLAIAEVELRLGSLGPVDALAVPGHSPARVLHELGEDRACRGIVLGASRHATQDGLLPGTVAGRLLQGSGVPVAVAPRGFAHAHGMRLQTIGVAHIDTPEGREALDRASRLAAGSGARLRVITVFDGLLRHPDASAIDRAADRERARRAFDAALATVAPAIRAEGLWLEGEPLDELTEATAGLDLIVVGSRGYGPVRAVLLGGVSEPLMRQAACPVLAVPRPVHGRPPTRPAPHRQAASSA